MILNKLFLKMGKLSGILLLGFLCININESAFAGEFNISKVRFNLNKENRSDFLVVNQIADTKTTFQIRIKRWTQDPATGKDKLIDTDDIIASPKIFALTKGQEQVVRIIVKNQDAYKNKFYRMILNELPSNEPTTGTVLKLALSMNMPIFVYLEETKRIDKIKIDYNLVEEAGKNSDKKILKMKNNDNQHLQLKEIVINGEINAKEGERIAINKYLLPGISLEVPFESKSKIEHFIAVTDFGEIKIDNH